MHFDAGPPDWKLIQTKKLQMPVDNRTDGHIILPLRSFNPVAYGCRRCAQLRAAQIIAKKRLGRPYRETERQRDELTDRHIILTIPHWGNLSPSVGIKTIYIITAS